MNNREIASVLFNISVILRRQGANPFRVRAYRRTALRILRMRHSIAERAAAGKPLGLPRLGESLTAKIYALALTGRLPFYDQLCDTLPPDEARLLTVPGIGPTIAERIARDLGPTDADSLRRAAAEGKLQKVWGVGPRRTAAILDALAAA